MDDNAAENMYEMGIAEIADLLHISQSALRYYEEEGLISTVRTEGSGYRKYSLLSLAELTDIIIYRSLGIPVKKISSLMNSPIEETVAAVDGALRDASEQLRVLNQTLEMITLYNQRLHRFFSARSIGYRIIDKLDIDHLYPFSMKDSASIQAYMGNPQNTCYTVLFEDAEKSNIYIDCVLQPIEGNDDSALWSQEDHTGRFLECLMRTDYCYTDRNNLSEHIEYMKAHGMEPGFAIAEYLTFEYSDAEQKRYDYYLAWIQIL